MSGRQPNPAINGDRRRWGCFDIASPSTLGTAVATNTPTFGQECGSETVGDGVVDIYDTLLFLYSQYSLAPYSNLPTTHKTVTDVAPNSQNRCNSYLLNPFGSIQIYQCNNLDFSFNTLSGPLLSINEVSTFENGKWVEVLINKPTYASVIKFKNIVLDTYINEFDNINTNSPITSNKNQVWIPTNSHDMKYVSENSLNMGSIGKDASEHYFLLWIPDKHKTVCTSKDSSFSTNEHPYYHILQADVCAEHMGVTPSPPSPPPPLSPPPYSPPITETITLTFEPGWNWFALSIHVSDPSVNTIFDESVTNSTGYKLFSQVSSCQFYKDYGCYGSLKFLEEGQGYKLYTQKRFEITIRGTHVYDTFEYDIIPGWNWIGLTGSTSLDISTILPEMFDSRMYSNTHTTSFYNTSSFKGWYPNFILEPYKMYKLFSPISKKIVF